MNTYIKIMSLQKQSIIQNITKIFSTREIPNIEVGDTVKVGITVQEGNKERVQFTEGVIISIHRSQISSTFTLRKIFQGIGVEKIYPLYSPKIQIINIIKKAKVRRSKLYYLRNRKGKSARLKPRQY